MKKLILWIIVMVFLVSAVYAGLVDYEVTQENGKATLSIGGSIRKGLDGGIWKPIEEIDNLLLENEIGCNIISDGKTKVQDKKDLQCSKIKFNKVTGLYDIDINLSAISDLALNKPLPIDIVHKELNKTSKKLEDIRNNLNDVIFLHKDWGQLWTIGNVGFGDVIHIGEQSTTINLVANGSGLLGDTVIQSGSPNTNNGGAVNLYLIQGVDLALLQFNISAIPTNRNITEAYLNLTSYSAGNGACSDANVSGYSRYTSYEFTETYNTKTTMTPLINRSSVALPDPDNTPITFNVTTWVQSEYALGKLNLSFAFGAITCGGTDGQYYSGESASGTNAPTLIITYDVFPNSAPSLASATMNYTNATLFRTGENINASVSLTDTDAGDKHNFTIVMFINDIVNTTYQNNSNFVSGTFSYVLRDTNITGGNKVTIQFVATDGSASSNFINTTAVTVNSTLSMGNISFRTLNETSTSPINIYQYNRFIIVNISDSTQLAVRANISIIDSNNYAVVSNASMTNTTYDNFSFNNATLYNLTGIWNIRIYGSNGVDTLQNNISINISSPIHTFNTQSNATATGGTEQQFNLSMDFDPTGIVSANASFKYNNTIYTSNLTLINASIYQALNNITTPVVSIATTKAFNWTIGLYMGSNNSYQVNATGYSQSLNPLGLKYCAGTKDIPAYNFSFLNENNGSITNATLQATFIVYINDISANSTYFFNLTNSTSYPICLVENSTTLKTNAMLNYYYIDNTLYDPRQYYLHNATVTNVTQNITLYLLDITLANAVDFRITNELDQPLKERYIQIQRYDVGSNSYRTIAMGKTNENGEDRIYLRLNDAFHRIYIYENNTIVFTTPSLTKFTASTYNIIVTTNLVSEIMRKFNDVVITSPLSFDNNSKTVSFSFSNPTGNVNEVCLIVTKQGQGVLHDNCVTSSSGTLFYVVGNQTGEFVANIMLKVNPEKIMDSLILDLLESGNPPIFDDMAILGLLLISLTVAGAGYLAGVIGAGIGLILGLVASKMLYLLNISWVIIVVTIIIVGAFLYKTNE